MEIKYKLYFEKPILTFTLSRNILERRELDGNPW